MLLVLLVSEKLELFENVKQGVKNRICEKTISLWLSMPLNKLFRIGKSLQTDLS